MWSKKHPGCSQMLSEACAQTPGCSFTNISEDQRPVVRFLLPDRGLYQRIRINRTPFICLSGSLLFLLIQRRSQQLTNFGATYQECCCGDEGEDEPKIKWDVYYVTPCVHAHIKTHNRTASYPWLRLVQANWHLPLLSSFRASQS